MKKDQNNRTEGGELWSPSEIGDCHVNHFVNHVDGAPRVQGLSRKSLLDCKGCVEVCVFLDFQWVCVTFGTSEGPCLNLPLY